MSQKIRRSWGRQIDEKMVFCFYHFKGAKDMDQVKIGKFIAQLRHEGNMTQEELGKKLGVTNKTISRWENGNYMPDIETLKLLSEVFRISINELLCGEKLTDANFRKKADENIAAVYRDSSFTVKEQSAYWKRKWLKEHIALIVSCGLITICLFFWAWYMFLPWLCGACPLLCLTVYALLHNRMMIYIEDRIYPESGAK